jgi:hypothetical protein
MPVQQANKRAAGSILSVEKIKKRGKTLMLGKVVPLLELRVRIVDPA